MEFPNKDLSLEVTELREATPDEMNECFELANLWLSKYAGGRWNSVKSAARSSVACFIAAQRGINPFTKNEG